MTPTKILGLLLVIIYVVALKVLSALDTGSIFEHRLLLPILNTLFAGIIPIIVAYIAAKAYVKGGSGTTLFLGCGMLSFGLCAISAGWLIRASDGANLNVTVYNTGALLGSAFHAIGAILSLVHTDYSTEVVGRRRRATTALVGVTLFVLCFSLAALRGLIPPFFIQGVGPTELRQGILGSSVLLYSISSVFLMAYYLKGKSDFLYWYSLCLAMLAIGLFAFFVQKMVGSPIGWLGRSANYFGGIFAIVAVLRAWRDARTEGVSLEESIAGFFGEAAASHEGRLLPVLPIPIFLILLIIMASWDPKTVFDPPGLLASLHTLFLSVLPLAVVYFATRGYIHTGLLTMLMLGSGTLTFGLGSLLSGWAIALEGGGPNATVTIVNLSALGSAIFYVLSGIFALIGVQPNKDASYKKIIVVLTYLGITVALVLITSASLKNLLPVFFIQGEGPTALRQPVIWTTLALFAVSGLLFMGLYFVSRTKLLYWYMLALFLLATGFLCYAFAKSVGSPITWLGRSALYLAAIYLFLAVTSASKELRVRGESPETGIANLFRHHLESLVREQTVQLAQVNDELLKANRRLEALMNALPVGVSFSDDASCQRITGNPHLFAQFEIAPEDNISASAPDPTAPGRLVHFFHEGREIRDTELPLQRAVAENRVLPPIELEVQLPNGRSWFAEASGAPIRDNRGNVVGGVAVTVDITERKQAEQDLKTTVQRFHSILSNQYVGLLLVSEEGRIEFANQAFCDQFELKVSPSELQGLTPDDIIKQIQNVYAEPSQAIDRIREIVQQRKSVKDEEIAVSGGKTYLRDFIPIVIDGKPFGRLWHHRDISDRRQAEEALQKAHDELERALNTLAEAQKIAHLGSFEYVAATQTTVWSEEEYRIYGLDPAVPSPTYDLMLQNCIHPDDAVLLHETFTQAMQSRSVYELEHRIVQPNGSVRWVY
ncbi:MAG TPA: PAS domain S-box protein, partial [Desulfomonilaceae bacterium]|nr:PAS domain S-box protein [Desulfomonilaceae bacterium]